MKSRGLAVIICLVSIAIFTGCKTKGNLSSGQGKTGDEEAQRVAEKFGDLLISKCTGGYMFGLFRPLLFPPPHLYPTPFIVKAKSITISPHSIGHFYGYDWMGYVEVSRPEWGENVPLLETGFQIYKRGGQWFYRPGRNEGEYPAFGDMGNLPAKREPWPEGIESDVPIDALQPIRAECPTSNAPGK
jgi:hypothetical protein